MAADLHLLRQVAPALIARAVAAIV